MKRICALLLTVLVHLAGCGDFNAVEMDLVSGGNTRPIAIVCEPAEAAPGDTVLVRLYFYEPRGEAAPFDVGWQVTLDFAFDLYGETALENRLVDLDLDDPIEQPHIGADGLGVQQFRYVVPQDVLVRSSGMPERFVVPLPPDILAAIDPASPDFVTREELDAYLSTVDPATLDRPEVAALADLFAGQIRFRARIRTDIDLDVTKNLTVRYSSRGPTFNVNRNPHLLSLQILTVQTPDLDDPDRHTLYEWTAVSIWDEDEPEIQDTEIVINPEWTYYARIRFERQSYLSPTGAQHEEDHRYNWYFDRLDPAAEPHQLLVRNDGKEAMMGDLNSDYVRLAPLAGAGGLRFRLFCVVRDFRPEWRPYNGTPGATYLSAPLTFAAPGR